MYFIFRYDSSKEISFAHRRRIKLAGLTVSTKAQTTCHYSTGRINITDNRAASYALKQMLQPRPGFTSFTYSSLIRVDTK